MRGKKYTFFRKCECGQQFEGMVNVEDKHQNQQYNPA